MQRRAELALAAAAQSTGVPVFIYRIGLALGSTENDGLGAADNMFTWLIRAAKTFKKVSRPPLTVTHLRRLAPNTHAFFVDEVRRAEDSDFKGRRICPQRLVAEKLAASTLLMRSCVPIALAVHHIRPPISQRTEGSC